MTARDFLAWDSPALHPQATALVWPEPTLAEQPAGAVATAQAAQGTPDESYPPAPSAGPAAALPEPAEPPDLDRLGDQIAELSARIDAAAAYEAAVLRCTSSISG